MRILKRDMNVQLSQESLSVKLTGRTEHRTTNQEPESGSARPTSVLEQLSAAARDALEAFPKNTN
jgi:hypothetical protein